MPDSVWTMIPSLLVCYQKDNFWCYKTPDFLHLLVSGDQIMSSVWVLGEPEVSSVSLDGLEWVSVELRVSWSEQCFYAVKDDIGCNTDWFLDWRWSSIILSDLWFCPLLLANTDEWHLCKIFMWINCELLIEILLFSFSSGQGQIVRSWIVTFSFKF